MSQGTEPEELSAEVERLRAERDRLAAEAAKLDRRVHGGRSRRALVGVLAVLSVISFLTASLGYWANKNLLRTDVWVERVGPLASDPAVQKALANELTDQVMALVDTKTLFEDALPPKAQILATPLSSAVRTFVSSRVQTFVEGRRFQQIWVTMLEKGHREAVAVLRGEQDSGTIQTADGKVVVNLIPAIDAILERISEISPELFGHEVKLPKLTAADLPGVARQKLADALGVQLSDEFGVITLYEGSALSSAQQAINLFDKALVLSIVLFVAFTAAALALSRRRRRTGLQLLVGFALVTVLVRRLVLRLTSDVLDLIQIPGRRAAAQSIIRAFADPLLNSSGWILTGFAVAIALLVVTGPYPWIVSLRQRSLTMAKGGVAAAEGVATSDATVAWMQGHVVGLQWAGGLLFVAALWWWDLSWVGLLVLAAAIGAFELYVTRLAADAADDPEGDDGGPDAASPDPTDPATA